MEFLDAALFVAVATRKDVVGYHLTRSGKELVELRGSKKQLSIVSVGAPNMRSIVYLEG